MAEFGPRPPGVWAGLVVVARSSQSTSPANAPASAGVGAGRAADLRSIKALRDRRRHQGRMDDGVARHGGIDRASGSGAARIRCEPRPRRRPIALIALALVGLGGCASTPSGPDAGDPIFGLGGSTPERLEEIARTPYAPTSGGCEAVARQIAELDDALGPDVDIEAADDGSASGWLVDGVRALVPYRGAVRLVTGASRADRKRAAILLAASVRRGYLKGVRETLECPGP